MRIASPVLAALVQLLIVGGPTPAIGLTDVSNLAPAGWVDTGIRVTPAGPLRMAATGSTSPNGVDESERPGGDLGPCGTCIEPLPNHRYALVGRVGSTPGTGLPVASSDSDVTAQYGNPFLVFHDDFHGDESGSFLGPRTVVPQLETGLLLASGILGLVVLRRFPATCGAIV